MRIGTWSARHPWRAICAWLAFVLAAVALGAIAGTKTLDNGAVGESARGYTMIDHHHLWGPAHELAFVRTRHGAVPEAAVAEISHIFRERGLRPESHISADRHAALVSAAVTDENGARRVREAVVAAQRAHPELRIVETGDISADRARNDIVDRDLHRAELLSIPVTLAVLLFAFGALTAAIVPVVLALTAVAAGFGLLGPLSQLFPVEDSAKTVVLLIGMAVGVDYALFFVARSRAERLRGRTPTEAVETAVQTSGRAVLVSGATVAAALAGMYVVGVGTLSGIATATIAVVGCAVLGSLTVLPAALVLLGSRVDRGRIPFLGRSRAPSVARFWPAVVAAVARRPALAATAGTAVLAALALPALSLHLSKPSDLALAAQTNPTLRALAEVRQAFAGAGDTAEVAVVAPKGSREQLRDAVAELRARAVRERLAHEPVGVTASPDGTAAAISLPLAGDGANAASRRAVDDLRRRLVPATLGRVPGAETAVTGHTAEDLDFTRQIRHALPFVLAFVLVLAFALLLVAFRSIVIPVKAIALNLLSVGSAYGILALVFEHRWAEGLLGFHSNGTIVAWLPLFLFVVLFGLSMDYHVFILSRVREAVDGGASTESAVRQSISATAGVVTAAAAVMVCVFALFGTLSSLELKQTGVGLAAAVLIDATLIRGVLLPASMLLLGERNWYLPRRLRWLPRLAPEASG